MTATDGFVQSLLDSGRLTVQDHDECVAELDQRGGPARVAMVEILFERGHISQEELVEHARRTSRTLPAVRSRRDAEPAPSPVPAAPAPLPRRTPSRRFGGAIGADPAVLGRVLLDRGLVSAEDLDAALDDVTSRLGAIPVLDASLIVSDPLPEPVPAAPSAPVAPMGFAAAARGVAERGFDGDILFDPDALGGGGLDDVLFACEARFARSTVEGDAREALGPVFAAAPEAAPALEPAPTFGETPDPEATRAPVRAPAVILVDDALDNDEIRAALAHADSLRRSAAERRASGEGNGAPHRAAAPLPPPSRRFALDEVRRLGRSGADVLGDVLVEKGLVDSDSLADARRSADALARSAALTAAGVGGAAPAVDPPASSSAGGSGEGGLGGLVRYALTGKVGEGCVGVVFRGEDVFEDKAVALKFFLDADLAREQIERETTVVRELRHPRIVPAHTAGFHGDKMFLARSYVEGLDLATLAERGLLSIGRVAEVFGEIARALDHCHTRNVAHLNLKPQNVIVGASGKPFITDFGSVKQQRGANRSAPVTWHDRTASYVAPEQADPDRGALGPATDIFALGAMLWHVLTKRPPFLGEGLATAMRQVCFDDPKRPAAIEESASADLEMLARQCLEKEPGRRPTARALAEQLERVARGEKLGLFVRLPVRVTRLLAGAFVVMVVAVAAYGIGSYHRLLVERERRMELARIARDAFEAACAETVAADATPTDRREHYARVVALGVKAREAADRVTSLVPDDLEARGQAFDVALAVGEVAVEAERWRLALDAFGRARALGVDEARVAEALGRAERQRDGLHARRAELLEAVLADARNGALLDRPGGYEGALGALLAAASSQTVVALAQMLDAVTFELDRTTRDAYLAAAEPTDDERARAQGPIDGIDLALARLAAPGEAASAEQLAAARAVIARAERRLEDRAARAGRRRLTIGRILAEAQRERVGPGRLLAARLCCDALGGIGLADGAAPAIERYLAVEQDDLRAASAAVALFLMGPDAAAPAIAAARARFGEQSSFWRRVAPIVDGAAASATGSASGADVATHMLRARAFEATGNQGEALASYGRAISAEPRYATAWLGRGLLHLERGAIGDAVADLGQAIALEPESAIAWQARGRALRLLGDLTRAFADLERAIALEPELAAAWSERGEARRAAGRLDEALADLDRAIALAPDLGVAHLRRGLVLRARNEPERALAAFAAAVESDRGLADAWVEIGRCLEARGDARGAVDAFSRAASGGAGSEAARRALRERARVRRAQGDLAGARADVERALVARADDAAALAERSAIAQAGGEHEAAQRDAASAVSMDPADPVGWSRLADARAALGDRRGAADALGRALALAPRDVALRLRRADLLAALGERDGALADHDRAVALAPDDAAVAIARGDALLAAGRAARAKEDFARAMKLEPDEARAFARHGLARAALGDHPGAIVDCSFAIEMAPDLGEAYLVRARSRRATGDLVAARADLERATRLDPSLAGAFVDLGELRLAAGDRDGAIVAFSGALARDSRAARAWSGRGQALFARGDLAGAIGDLARALALDPRDVRALRARGAALARRGDRRRAIADLSRAIAIEPSHAPTFVERGVARHDGGDHRGAIGDFTRALVLDADAPGAHVGRARARLASGDAAGALDDLGAAIARRPSGDAFALRARIRQDRGDLSGAISDLDAAVAAGPVDADLLATRGTARQLAGDLPGAIADLRAALERRPKDAASWNNLGVALHARGDAKGAVDAYGRAIELEPGLAAAWGGRGFARAELGQTEAAAADLARCLELGAPDRLGARARMKLRGLRPAASR